MNTAKLVNSALTGGGLIYPENLNVIIGNENKGYPKGYVLDANATLSLAGQASQGSGSQTPGQQGGNSNNTSSNLDKYIKPSQVLYSVDNTGNKSYTTQLNMLSEKENGYLSIDLQSKEYPSDFSLNHVSGDANLNLGNINVILGKNNLAIGSGLYSTKDASNNILLGFRISIQVKKNPGGKLRLLVKKGSIIEYQLKEGLLGIIDRFAINIKDNKLVFEKIFDTETLTRVSNNFTRIDDNTIEMNNSNLDKLSECYYVVAVSVTSDGRSNILAGNAIFNGGHNSIFVGTALNGKLSSTYNYPNNAQCFGLGNKVSNSCEFASGAYNITNNKTVGNYQYNTVFSIGAGSLSKGNLNALELIAKKNTTDNTSINALYVNGVGGYDGTNVSDDNTKSLQQVISDIETAVSLNSNGPWDVDITSQFINGNVDISPTQMWSINQGAKRVYFVTDLKQGDIITIPDTLRMYIGWKKADNTFGEANWVTSAKKYTVTVDGKYVILLDTPSANNPGIQTNTISSFGKVMLKTSNQEFKPTAQTDIKKDHTNDDKVMRGIAHQGFHKMERANSLAAFRAAAKEGWRYVETDTYMTTDGKFIVSHDPYLPTGWTNGTVTTTQGSYKYEEHTLAEILAFHGPNNEKTDTLEEFCKTCKECGLHPYIELKQGKMADTNTLDTNPRYNGKGYGVKVLDIVNRYGLRGNATFIASVPFTLLRMAREDQSYRYGIVYFGQLKNSDAAWATVLSKIDEYNNDAVASKAYLFLDANINNLKVADADAVDKLVQKNCALEVWTATTKEDLDNLDPYVTGVTSDNIHAGEILAKKI